MVLRGRLTAIEVGSDSADKVSEEGAISTGESSIKICPVLRDADVVLRSYCRRL
jgi:hypothetical protein